MVRAINLDQEFIPTCHPEIEFAKSKFSSGEMHININCMIDYNSVEKVVVTNRISSGDDIMLILLAVDALRQKGIRRFDLILPYLPYSRQDRVCKDGDPLASKVFCSLINTVKFENVYTIDAHSDVSVALLDNCTNIQPASFVSQFIKTNINQSEKVFLVAPDVGASKRISLVHSALSVDVKNMVEDIVVCSKTRDLSTGKISSLQVLTSKDLSGSTCVIVDDICSYGNTFIGVAEQLKKLGAKKVLLFTTHNEGVFEKNHTSLFDYIDVIGFTNSIKSSIESNKINVIKINL